MPDYADFPHLTSPILTSSKSQASSEIKVGIAGSSTAAPTTKTNMNVLPTQYCNVPEKGMTKVQSLQMQ
jgi:hypothetical protein